MGCLPLLTFTLLNVIHCAGVAVEAVPGPSSPSEWTSWLQNLIEYRNKSLVSIGYNGSIYEVPQLLWTQTSYIQPQMHPFDLYFYDPVSRSYTIDRHMTPLGTCCALSWARYLEDLRSRYGGIDSMLMWPTYPNIGVDNRNQLDLFRSAPGGVEELKKVVAELHAHGVEVLVPYNPWDTGSRRESTDDAHAFASFIAEIGADGFNGDTMNSVPEEFYTAACNIGHPIAIEPEGGGTLETMPWDTIGWGYWNYPWAPMVDNYKWLDPRRMTNVCNRWAMNKTDDLQFAWFNGVGYESWENVWGIWNGITPRDSEAVRRVAAMSRFLGKERFLMSPGWQPHFPTLQPDWIYASMWPKGDEAVWTLVNRAGNDSSGPQLRVTMAPGTHFYDCYHEVNGSIASLSFSMENLGYGCVLATPNVTQRGDGTVLGDFLQLMFGMTERALSSFSTQWECIPQYITDVDPSPPHGTAPPGMKKIPAVVSYPFVVSGVEIEGPWDFSVDFAYPFELDQHSGCPWREHNISIPIAEFYIDEFPVTNRDFKVFLNRTGYVPRDPYNFLKHWNGSNYPSGWDNKPVTWVSLEEARSYCRWAYKRLPREWEWQYAAQGTDGRLYPWGNDKDQARYPKRLDGNEMPPPADVDAHSPAGNSPFGVGDMVGNVWQWTDEFQDAHTRCAVMRGSSCYRPTGAPWYFPPALELNKHQKLLLWDESYDRSGGIGFRCAADSGGIGLFNGSE